MTINKRFASNYYSDRFAAARRDISGDSYFATPDGVTEPSLLLDLHPGAVAAYSLRKLRTAYTGSAIRVRRSSDSAEQDIGFTSSGDLDESALTTFCGGGDGFVTTWYDQSGNTFNATQVVANSQMQIVSGGSVVVDSSGNVALSSDGSQTSYTVATHAAISQPWSVVSVSQHNRTNDNIIWSGQTLVFQGYYSSNPLSLYAGAYLNSGTSSTGRFVLFSTANGASSVYSENGAAVTGDAGLRSINANTLVLSGFSGSREILGLLQEVVFWTNDQSSNRVGIESNINDYWSLY
jgi:hypothetical protein